MITRLGAVLLAAGLCITASTQANDQAGELDPRKRDRLQATIMNQNMPLDNRISALRTLHADLIVDGKIHRSFCVWDPLGRSGPIYTTVDDQRFRSLHYGLSLMLEAYQDEGAMITAFKDGKCDAALMSGSRALEFNKYAGSIEALGAVPDATHLQLLAQVLSSPRTAEHLQNDKYIVLGVASMGENYLYTNNVNEHSLASLKGKNIGVPSYDISLNALAKNASATAVQGELLAVVDGFVEGRTPALLAPLIGYHVAGAGKALEGSGIVNAPLSHSTIQLIGHTERFPLGLAQMLREDFLFKFESYIRRVETERQHIPASAWLNIGEQQIAALDSQLREQRIRLRNQGIYDAQMLKVLKRIRCRIDGQRSECADNRE